VPPCNPGGAQLGGAASIFMIRAVNLRLWNLKFQKWVEDTEVCLERHGVGLAKQSRAHRCAHQFWQTTKENFCSSGLHVARPAHHVPRFNTTVKWTSEICRDLLMLWMLGFLELSLLSPWGHNVWPFRWAHLVWHDSLARSWFGGAGEERALPRRKHDSWTCQEWSSWLDPLVLIQCFGVDCLAKFRIRRSPREIVRRRGTPPD